MKNKCDSETTEGSNDDYFHLIQVKWVEIDIFLHISMSHLTLERLTLFHMISF